MAANLPTANPNRPTATWKLVELGVVGFLALIGVSGLLDVQLNSAAIGQVGIGVLFVALGIAGGWRALRRRS